MRVPIQRTGLAWLACALAISAVAACAQDRAATSDAADAAETRATAGTHPETPESRDAEDTTEPTRADTATTQDTDRDFPTETATAQDTGPDFPAETATTQDTGPDFPAETTTAQDTGLDLLLDAADSDDTAPDTTDTTDTTETGAPSDTLAPDAPDSDVPPTFGWAQLPAAGLPAARVRGLAVTTAGTIYAACDGVGIYRSLDAGASFTRLATPTTANDPPTLILRSLGLNDLDEPIVGVAVAGNALTNTTVLRFDAAANTWATAAVTQPMSQGGYFPPAFRRDPLGGLLTTWPFRNDIMRSTDHGASWTNAYPIPNAAHIPPDGPSPTVKAVYGVAAHPLSGELFVGSEGDEWWHSTDHGASWALIDPDGVSALGVEPGQNGFLIAFNKDAEPLIGTQGKPDGNFLLRVTSDGQIVPSNTGFGVWAMVGTASAQTVLREIALTGEGYNLMAMPVNNNQGGAFPCEAYGSPDGATWTSLLAPFVPELNSVFAHGETVFVGGGASSPGVIWTYTPPRTSRLPRVQTGFVPGAIATAPLAGLTLAGSATDPDGDTLVTTWKARGPGNVTFTEPAATMTGVSFDIPGDYVLTLHATDGVRSAGAPVIVHVTAP